MSTQKRAPYSKSGMRSFVGFQGFFSIRPTDRQASASTMGTAAYPGLACPPERST